MFKKILLNSLAVLLLAACAQTPVNPVPEPEPEPEPDPIYSIFNGQEIESEAEKGIAVMIGNTSEARPQYGLSLADVVYEISVETMTITRYLAIFGNNFPKKVGPVRSVRIPFLIVSDEWKVGFSHFGGAAVGKGDALGMMKDMFIPIRYDGVENINSEYFSRSSDRKAPHNAFMDMASAEKKLPDMWPQKHFSFSDEENYEDQDDALLVHIDYTRFIRNAYSYDEASGQYIKFLNDKEHIDALTDEPIMVTNVIVQYAKHQMVEAANYVLVDFYYQGAAEYFIGGKQIKGYWTKDHKDDVTHWYDEDGKEIQFKRGNTWIHVFPDNKTDSVYVEDASK